MSKKKTIIASLIAGLSLCALAGCAAIKLYLNDLEPIPNLANYHRNIVTQVLSSDERIIKTFQAYNYEHATIDEIPKYLKDAIISTEDKNFYTHEGYDILGICRSVVVNIVNKKASQGASTITQQLARVLFLSNEKTITRKLKEIQIAARIEKSIPKDKILEMYLNNVYLGSGAYGIGAAASTYFNKPLSELTLAECALIAGLPQAPSVYSPYRNKKLAEKRRNKVLRRMYIMKTIDKKQYESALKEPITLNKKPSMVQANIAPYFVDYVLRELEELGFDEEYSYISAKVNGRDSGILIVADMYPCDYNKLVESNWENLVNLSKQLFDCEKMDVYVVGAGLMNKHVPEEERGVFKIGAKYAVSYGNNVLPAHNPA